MHVCMYVCSLRSKPMTLVFLVPCTHQLSKRNTNLHYRKTQHTGDNIHIKSVSNRYVNGIKRIRYHTLHRLGPACV